MDSVNSVLTKVMSNLALPCNEDGSYPAPGHSPPRVPEQKSSPTDWGPFESSTAFRIAELLYAKSQMSENDLDKLMDLWDLTGDAPFSSHADLHEAIDSISVSDIPWQSFSVQYSGEASDPDSHQPQWKSDIHEVFYRDPRLVIHEMLANPDFKDAMDYAPYIAMEEDSTQRFDNLMSGTWAWDQAVS